jgi:hypothetical protein
MSSTWLNQYFVKFKERCRGGIHQSLDRCWVSPEFKDFIGDVGQERIIDDSSSPSATFKSKRGLEDFGVGNSSKPLSMERINVK